MPLGSQPRCQVCAGAPPLYQRPDDNEETVVERLKVYESQTRPLLGYYSRRKLLQTIDAQGDIDDITELLVRALTQAAVPGMKVRAAATKKAAPRRKAAVKKKAVVKAKAKAKAKKKGKAKTKVRAKAKARAKAKVKVKAKAKTKRVARSKSTRRPARKSPTRKK
jgi:adenylate kinase